MYLRLSQGATITYFKEDWQTKVPRRSESSFGNWYRGDSHRLNRWPERMAHLMVAVRFVASWRMAIISFSYATCHLARFMWAGRELLPCNKNRIGVWDFITLAQGLSVPLRRLVWFTFAALCWTLSNIHNKLPMEGKMISSLVDALYKMSTLTIATENLITSV
jgi:hypothetical protein